MTKLKTSDLLDNLQPYQKEILKNWELKLSNGNKICIKPEDVKPLRGNTLDYIFIDNFNFKENEQTQTSIHC